MTFLVDANVLSEPTRLAPNGKVVDWLAANESEFVVNGVIVGELCAGVLALPRGRKRARLEQWFEAVVASMQCLPWDAAAGRRWAALVTDLKRKGEAVPVLDGMIAATALEHDLTIATRNTRDFTKTGAKVLNPFE